MWCFRQDDSSQLLITKGRYKVLFLYVLEECARVYLVDRYFYLDLFARSLHGSSMTDRE